MPHNGHSRCGTATEAAREFILSGLIARAMREGASNRQDRTAHTGSHTFLTTQLSRHERHEEHPPFIADFPKKVQEL
ncbi:hypothetical protein [Akkermansia muciniphila]|uniref:hypothetical protein n=1 Tax=Akkermansia muciniphila TaxID=239935 RepID=UPI001CA59639|nr:hypothetical protein [Akkermansia muciniphila]